MCLLRWLVEMEPDDQPFLGRELVCSEAQSDFCWAAA